LNASFSLLARLSLTVHCGICHGQQSGGHGPPDKIAIDSSPLRLVKVQQFTVNGKGTQVVGSVNSRMMQDRGSEFDKRAKLIASPLEVVSFDAVQINEDNRPVVLPIVFYQKVGGFCIAMPESGIVQFCQDVSNARGDPAPGRGVVFINLREVILQKKVEIGVGMDELIDVDTPDCVEPFASLQCRKRPGRWDAGREERACGIEIPDGSRGWY
jgi:hypothetical protein